MKDFQFVKAFCPFVNILDIGNDELKMIQSHVTFVKFGGTVILVLDQAKSQSGWMAQNHMDYLPVVASKVAASIRSQQVGVPKSTSAHVDNRKVKGEISSQARHRAIMAELWPLLV